MEGEDLDWTSDNKPREVRTGRRARATPAFTLDDNAGPGVEDDDISNDIGGGSSSPGPPRPSRRQGGWADDTGKEKKRGKKSMDDAVEDARLRSDSPPRRDDSDEDIPVIPDLDDVQEEDMATQIAAPPSLQVNKIATYRELDTDLFKQAAFLILDDEIDLKPLAKCLSAETDVLEEDKPWDWDRLFTEVTSELQVEWEAERPKEEDEPLPMQG
ncbi:intraflagellar transport protein 43 homolog A-like [Branchiostoma lanceolatum]|uniref:intraflagellar transport protein 43 homolog A-like n=1 Tax=Branchiostoma lanceolatum TaxID=7740 RepID=UPI001132E82D